MMYYKLYKKNLLILLIVFLLVLTLPSCSSAVSFEKGYKQAQYSDTTYVLYTDNGDLTYWIPLPSPEQIQKVDRTDIFPISASSFDPVYATLETPANFLIISTNGESAIKDRSSIALKRVDLELSSVFETKYAGIQVKYANGVSESEKVIEEFISNKSTFTDIVGEEPNTTTQRPTDAIVYCTLYCTHPEIDYLVCKLTVLVSNDQYYLLVYPESNQEMYYLLNLQ